MSPWWRRLRARFSRETCPYCFETLRLRDTPFRCSSPAVRCPPQLDPVRQKAWNDATPMGKVLQAERKLHWQRRCPDCNELTHKRLCPYCHMELPRTLGEYANLIFAVIGAKEAGKSHYLAVLIEQIRKHVGPDTGMLLTPLDDRTMHRYRNDFYNPIYRRGVVIEATTSGLVDRQVRMPMVYTLTLTGDTPFGRRRIRGVVTLVFFDTAGEDLNQEDTISTVNKYIYRADGIILLLDPLQLPHVRNQLDAAVPLPEENTEAADILVRVTRLIRRGRELLQSKKIPTPMALAFSKFDAVEDLVDPQFQLLSEADHRDGYDRPDFVAVDAEMRSLLEQWDSRLLQHHLETDYRTFGFFGLSALGCNPHGDQKVPSVLPRRVEDPFLWLLHHHGLLAARKS